MSTSLNPTDKNIEIARSDNVIMVRTSAPPHLCINF